MKATVGGAAVAAVALLTGAVGELGGPGVSFGETAHVDGAGGGHPHPVFDSPETRQRIGTMGERDGQVACQDQFLFQPYDAQGRVSDWWVQARADNGQWGWVPAVALADIGDWAPLPGLQRCGTGPTLIPGPIGTLRPE